jgi:NAD(P)-dependent dehydrogenase (short-subunit alcohol dehydrogenase family)
MAMDQGDAPDYLASLRLDGRAFVVLGSGAGIGRQTTLALAQAGASVVCVDQQPELAQAAAEGVGGVPVTADIGDRGELERVFDEARRALGPVTGLVDIVGQPHLGPLADLDDAHWRSQLALVLDHAFLAMQVGGREIAAAGGGSMVFVGSISGMTHIPGQSAYGAAKAALHHLVACMAGELAPAGVRVNGVAPGFVRTPRLNARLDEGQWEQIGAVIPRGEPGTPPEIAGPILFLASDLAAYVTGQVVRADGGLSGTTRIPDLW